MRDGKTGAAGSGRGPTAAAPMRDGAALGRVLARIDGRGYASYKQLAGQWRLGALRLAVDHVQVDPYAPPSRMRLIVDAATAGLPADLIDDAVGRTGAADFLTRGFARVAHRLVPEPVGTGGSGLVSIGRPGQEVLERTGVVIAADRVEARIDVGLPASGRRIRGHRAAELLTDVLPRIADASLLHANLDRGALREHVTLLRDQERLRSLLPERGLVAFIADGAILPRRAGDCDLPLTGDAVVPFVSPRSLRVAFDLPSGRRVTGMGVPEGVSVIVGGGYHGKSTLLRAIERGVYPHIAGDGREWVITRPDAVTVRAEDGRAVTGVDISPFIAGLPSGADTRSFSTTNASGSTSQAANLVEAVGAGASTLLIDEDTSATNFMIRDEHMRALIPADQEPITPFIDRVRPLFTELGVSTILVAGGSGAFFDVADLVIAINRYVPSDVTERARELAGAPVREPTTASGVGAPGAGASGAPGVLGASPPGARRAVLRPSGTTTPARARGRTSIHYGRDTIDLAAVAQLVDAAQTQAVAHALDRLSGVLGGREGLSDAIDELLRRIDRDGLDWLSPHRGHPGHLARPRRHELHAAVNRCRGLRVRPAREIAG